MTRPSGQLSRLTGFTVERGGAGLLRMPKPTAKVFQSGNSQAVRLPAEFRFDVDEVFIERDGDKVILSPRPTSWDAFFSSRVRPTEDFM